MKTTLGKTTLRLILGSALVAALFTVFGVAQADVSKTVEKAFRGQILITDTPLPPAGETDAQTINAYKKATAKSLKSTDDDGTAQWSFLFTAFLKKAPRTEALSMDFYTDDKDKLYVADKRFVGIDPKGTILSGQVAITEDDGLVKGRSYVVKLTGKVKRREVVFAQAKLTMK